MKIEGTKLETINISSEKASELDKTLSKGGIIRSDGETAFPKKYGR